LMAIGYGVFLYLHNRLFHYYFILLFPFLALCTGYAVHQLIILPLTNILIRLRKKLKKGSNKRVFLWLGCIILFLLLGEIYHRNIEHSFSYFKHRAGTSNYYIWKDTVLAGPFNSLIRMLFWPEERIIGNRYTGINYYLWHESRAFDEVEEIAKYVRMNSIPNETLFGDSTTTSIIALFANRRIEQDFVDTNKMNFRSGIIPIKKAIDILNTSQLRFIVYSPRRAGISKLKPFRKRVFEKFEKEKEFTTRYHGKIILMGHKKDY